MPSVYQLLAKGPPPFLGLSSFLHQAAPSAEPALA